MAKQKDIILYGQAKRYHLSFNLSQFKQSKIWKFNATVSFPDHDKSVSVIAKNIQKNIAKIKIKLEKKS